MLTGNPKEAVPSYDLLDVNTVKSMLAFGLAHHQPCPWPHWLLTVLRNIPPRGANSHQIQIFTTKIPQETTSGKSPCGAPVGNICGGS